VRDEAMPKPGRNGMVTIKVCSGWDLLKIVA